MNKSKYMQKKIIMVLSAESLYPVFSAVCEAAVYQAGPSAAVYHSGLSASVRHVGPSGAVRHVGAFRCNGVTVYVVTDLSACCYKTDDFFDKPSMSLVKNQLTIYYLMSRLSSNIFFQLN